MLALSTIPYDLPIPDVKREESGGGGGGGEKEKKEETGTGKNNNKLKKNIMNSVTCIMANTMPYVTNLHLRLRPISYRLTAQQEPYKK